MFFLNHFSATNLMAYQDKSLESKMFYYRLHGGHPVVVGSSGYPPIIEGHRLELPVALF
jgi:hypothetical protein